MFSSFFILNLEINWNDFKYLISKSVLINFYLSIRHSKCRIDRFKS